MPTLASRVSMRSKNVLVASDEIVIARKSRSVGLAAAKGRRKSVGAATDHASGACDPQGRLCLAGRLLSADAALVPRSHDSRAVRTVTLQHVATARAYRP